MNHKPTETIATDPKRRFLCRHIFDDGHRCGSPSLRGESFCYYHIRTRRHGPGAGRAGNFTLSHAADRASIQLAIADVLCRLAAGDIEIKRGTALLYGLQVASSNLGRQPQTQLQPQVDDFTEDFHYGDLAPIAEIPIDLPEAAPNPADITPIAEIPIDRPAAAQNPATSAQEPPECTGEASIGRAFSPDASRDTQIDPGFSPRDLQTRPETGPTAQSITPEQTDDQPDAPELAPAAPSIHLPRPTAHQLLRRRKPAFIHNSDEKDFSLYPPIRPELIFTPTAEELAESFAAAPPQPNPERVLSACAAS